MLIIGAVVVARVNHSQLLLAAAVCCLLVGAIPAVAGSSDGVVEPAVQSELAENGTTEVIVSFESDGLAVGTDARFGAVETDRAVEQLQAEATRAHEPLGAVAARHDHLVVENRFWLTNAALVRVTDASALEVLSSLEGVDRVIPNVELKTTSAGSATTADPATTSSTSVTTSVVATTWGVDEVEAPAVWDRFETKGEGATVAVLDTGVDPDHPDIDLSNWSKFDSDGSKNGSVAPKDYGSHGTHVSGTATGGNAGGQYIGVAPEAELHHGAVLTDNCNNRCTGTLAQIIGGMEWATNNSVEVISMSLGATGYYEAFIDPIRNAENAGITVVAAVGNRGEGTSGSPGNVYDAISVGATDSTRDVAPFSSGELVDTSKNWSQAPVKNQSWPEEYIVPSVSAPGVFINSSLPGGRYGEKSGTSMATPHVSGVAALAHAASRDSVGPNELETAMEQTAFKPSDARKPAGQRDRRHGAGIVNASAVVDEFADPPINASFTYSPQPPVTNETVTFDASTSEGNITSYGWSFDDGTTLTVGSATTTHEFGSTGEYNVTLTVEDSEGKTDTTNRTVSVEAPAVNATFTVTPESPYATENVSFDASDSEGLVDSYNWTFGDGTGVTTGSAVTNHTYDTAGSYEVSLTVEDQSGETNTTNRTVTVQEPPTLNARFTVTPSAPEANEAATFDATDSEGLIDSYDWEFGDGATATGETATHAYDSAGNYQVNLTVTDGTGVTNTTSRTISVSPPTLNASFEMTPANPYTGQGVSFDASATGGNVVSYSWEFTEDGVPDDSGETANWTFDDYGPTDVTLTVTNQTGATDSQTRSLPVGIAPVVGDDPPQDLNGNGLYHDVTGDGMFTVRDVQALFLNYNSDPVQNHTSAFDFAGDGGVGIGDVKALFDAYVAGEGVQ
jgi:subtilisin family serine protease